jgi:hypothetical protein
MATAAPAAPEHKGSLATQASSSLSGGDAPPPKTILATRLATDERYKSALRRIVFVLPLTLLIFTEALRNPTHEVQLPIIGLKILLQSAMPTFFLIICYMVFRGIRYSRLILLEIFDIPSRTNQLVQIVVDNADAYKIDSTYYDESLDPTTAELIEEFQKKPRLAGAFNAVLIWFNIFKVFWIYGLIFSLLFFIALYVSNELLALVTQEFAGLNATTLLGTSKAVDIVVLCLSAALMLLGWLNAAIVLLLLLLIIVMIGGLAFVAAIRCIRTTLHFMHRNISKRPAVTGGEKGPETMTNAELLAMLDKFGLSSKPHQTVRQDTSLFGVKSWIRKNLRF